MFDGLKSITERIATPGDIAFAVPAGIIGYSLDATVDVVAAMEPGVVGGLSLAGALAVKKAFEAGRMQVTERRRRKRLVANAGLLREMFVRDGRADLAERVDRVLASHEIHRDEDRLARQLEDAIDEYERGAPVEPSKLAPVPPRSLR